MSNNDLLEASSRIALAAFLHDLGKFAERAAIDVPAETLDANLHQYSPFHQRGPRNWFSHRHAAYTAVAMDLIEPHLPALKGHDLDPFADWGTPGVDDSLINAAARHHKPETFLQWIVATADRVASGFEREKFEQYNNAEEGTSTKKNHYTARQLTLFEQIRLDGGPPEKKQPSWRYPLRPLTPKSIFPVKAAGYETDNKAAAQKEYRRLWNQFLLAITEIPASHRGSLPLWLDHFDSLWACFTHAIPAATAFQVRPEVSLYDHSHTTAALAVALWRYHHDRDDDPDEVLAGLQYRGDWDQQKLLLIQGDLFGIQDFIFANGGETQRRAAKLLRGRSFYVSLLTECAALKILEALSLPATGQVINAAGKFLIVAPNNADTLKRLQATRGELEQWFLRHAYGQSGIGIASTPASCNDFLSKHGEQRPFTRLMERLFEQLETAKLRRMDLCGAQPAPPLFDDYLGQFDPAKGACAVDGHSPASEPLPGSNNQWVCPLALDQIAIGGHLTRYQRLLITRGPLNERTLGVDLFGYHASFALAEDAQGRFGPEVRSGNLRRAWDFSLPESADQALWKGYARRYINAYVPVFAPPQAEDSERYRELADDSGALKPGDLKTLNHLACEDRIRDPNGDWRGISALSTLKGDVDNLGQIFRSGLQRPSFAKMAALSRQMNAFFAIHLPWLSREQFPNTYTVFAGGDDFFLIGPWRSQIELARQLRSDFARYVAANPDIHFSAGIAATKPGIPIPTLADNGEQALETAKAHQADPRHAVSKNAVTCFGRTVDWLRFEQLQQALDKLQAMAEQLDLSTGYLYGLLQLTDMAAGVARRPENAIWHAHFAYRTRRLLEREIKGDQETRRRQLQNEMAAILVEGGIEKFSGDYRIPLFTHLYRNRK